MATALFANIKIDKQNLIWIGVIYVAQIALALIFAHFYMRGQYMSVFDSFWASGDAVAHGRNPYMLLGETVVPKLSRLPEINMNPPALLPFFRLFALFEPWKAACLWVAISAALFILPALALIRQGGESLQKRRIAWLFFTPYAMNSLVAGQVYIVMFSLSACAWIALKKERPIPAGVLMGILAAIKPPFILWPACLFLARHFKPAIVAGVVATLLSLLPVILYGPGIYIEWLAAVALDRHAMTFPHEVSLNGFFLRAGMQPVGMALSGMLLLAASLTVWIRKPDAFKTTAVAIPVALLCSPLSWIDYVMVLFPAILASDWDRKMTGIAVLLLVPPSVSLIAIGGPVWEVTIFGFIFLLPVLLLAAKYILALYQPVPLAEQPSV